MSIEYICLIRATLWSMRLQRLTEALKHQLCTSKLATPQNQVTTMNIIKQELFTEGFSNHMQKCTGVCKL